MQVARISSRDAFAYQEYFTEKELILLREIGLDQIPTATLFVDFISERYSLSASGVWYTLKKLKKYGMLDFMEKGEGYKPLSLTSVGRSILRRQGQGSERLMKDQYAAIVQASF